MSDPGVMFGVLVGVVITVLSVMFGLELKRRARVVARLRAMGLDVRTPRFVERTRDWELRLPRLGIGRWWHVHWSATGVYQEFEVSAVERWQYFGQSSRSREIEARCPVETGSLRLQYTHSTIGRMLIQDRGLVGPGWYVRDGDERTGAKLASQIGSLIAAKRATVREVWIGDGMVSIVSGRELGLGPDGVEALIEVAVASRELIAKLGR